MYATCNNNVQNRKIKKEKGVTEQKNCLSRRLEFITNASVLLLVYLFSLILTHFTCRQYASTLVMIAGQTW